MQVTPFSRWERELPKLVGDERYLAVSSMKERKALFDDFCRSAAAKPAGKGAAAAAKPAATGAAAASAKTSGKTAANGSAEAAAEDAEEGETETGETEEAAAGDAADGADAEADFRCGWLRSYGCCSCLRCSSTEAWHCPASKP